MCGGGGEETWRRVAKPIGDGPEGAVDDPCSISEITTVNSPDRAVIGSLRAPRLRRRSRGGAEKPRLHL
jgi:hypothetical protein